MCFWGCRTYVDSNDPDTDEESPSYTGESDPSFLKSHLGNGGNYNGVH